MGQSEGLKLRPQSDCPLLVGATLRSHLHEKELHLFYHSQLAHLNPMSKSCKIAIVGAGLVGSTLGKGLLDKGHQVKWVKKRIARSSPQKGYIISQLPLGTFSACAPL